MPPLMLVSGLVLAIPLSFDLLATRSSPTYLPLWRPLPFLLMGGAVARFNGRRSSHGRAALSAGSLAVLVVQLGVFAEQLADIEAVADETPAGTQSGHHAQQPGHEEQPSQRQPGHEQECVHGHRLAADDPGRLCRRCVVGPRDSYGHPAMNAFWKHRKSDRSHTPGPVLVSQSQA